MPKDALLRHIGVEYKIILSIFRTLLKVQFPRGGTDRTVRGISVPGHTDCGSLIQTVHYGAKLQWKISLPWDEVETPVKFFVPHEEIFFR